MELTELEKKHAFSSQFMVNLWLYPIEQKYSMVMDEFKSAKEHYDNSDSEEEKAILTVKLQWLDAARITIEEEQERRACNRRYKPLDIPNVIPTPTEILESAMNELDADVKIIPPTVFVDYENGIRLTDNVEVEGQAWTKSVHQNMTEKQFIELYMNEGHTHIYSHMTDTQKKAALRLAYKACVPIPPKKVSISEK
jgi:hypothetical protein